MSETIERVAKALMNALHGHDDFEGAHPAMQEAYRRQSRAAIKAMLEPTEIEEIKKSAPEGLRPLPIGGVELSVTPACSGADTAALEWVREVLDVYFMPWGAAKAAHFEILTGNAPFDGEVVLKLIRDKLALPASD